jgi:hypothetical protein
MVLVSQPKMTLQARLQERMVPFSSKVRTPSMMFSRMVR